jgi:NAD(P)H-dependent flavin oxidoreductase YrpB (nitropropane dioxygenase family)
LSQTLRTPLCDVLGIDLPVIQAPIGSASCPELAAAVSNAGGLGMLSVTWRTIDELRALVRQTRALTDRPFGVNLVIQWPMAERLQACLEEGVRIVSLFWGDPSDYVAIVHAAGGIVLHTVGSAAEGLQAAQAGVDVIVAQGWEAGGHVRGDVSTFVLVPAVVDAVRTVPVVAAGGIADGRGLAAALMLGASGVWLGTRFVASQEAAVHPLYHEKIMAASESDTVYTCLFDGGWPAAAHRVLRNSTVTMWEAAGRPQAGARPGEGSVIAQRADGSNVLRYDDLPPVRGVTGNAEGLALYAGQSAGLVHDVLPAATIVRSIVDDAAAIMQSVAARASRLSG